MKRLYDTSLCRNNQSHIFIMKLVLSSMLVFYVLPMFAIESNIYVSKILKSSRDSILFSEDLPAVYSKLIVDVKCELGSKCLVLPFGAELIIKNKGYIDNGVIKGNNSILTVTSSKPCIGLNILISGTWNNTKVYDSWFDFDNSTNFVSNHIIKNVLSLSDDNHYCHIYFQADRIYFFEMPYKGEANLGDKLPYSMVGKVKKRNYEVLYQNKYSFIRIFTIPSNTHLTIQNHFKMLPSDQGAYFIFFEYGKKNVTIDGNGTISGDVQEHIYIPFVKGSNYYGEWGHIFNCIACTNFKFKDITIENSFGDCILFTGDYFNGQVQNRCSKGLVIDNVKIKHARRNGIVIAAQNVMIQNTLFDGCGIESIKGTAPKAAVDFEPDGIRLYPETGNDSVYMKDCVFINNKYDISSTLNNLETYNKVTTHISHCKFTAPLRLNTTNWIEFENCIIQDITNYKDKITKGTPIKHIIFKNCIIKKIPKILFTASWNNAFIKSEIIEIY